ncbi:MAG: 3'-5' exonuclease [Spirosomataceae bacterium]
MSEPSKKERNLLFIDIETVSCFPDFELLDERMQKLWSKKASYLKNEEDLTDAEMYFRRAGIYAEFGKIIAIGMGFFNQENDQRFLKVKTIYGHDEADLLGQFRQLIEKKYRSSELTLCAHNGKEFDFPYLCRRMLVNNIKIPVALQLQGRKPWEINHLDTLELWKFGDKKHYTSLELLGALFGVSQLKTEMSGEDVNTVYHKEHDLEKIKRYCTEDVIVLSQLYLKFNGETLIPESNIIRVE